MELHDLRIITDQCFTQRIIHRIDRAIALRRRVDQLTLHADFDHRFSEDAASLTMFNVDEKVHELKGRFVAVFLALQHHGNRGFGGFE